MSEKTQVIYSEEQKQRNFVEKPRIHYVMLVVFILATIAVVAGLVYIAVGDKVTSPWNSQTTPLPTQPSTTSFYMGMEARLKQIQASVGDTPKLHAVQNYQGWQSSIAEDIYVVAPENTQEIARVIKSAKQHSLKVRCIGSSLSFSDLWAEPGAILIKTSGLKTRTGGEPIVLDNSDPDNMLLTVAAGLTQVDLLDFLVENKVQIPVFGSAKQISLVGAISTATHQDYASRGAISDYVMAVELIDAEGQTREYDWKSTPRELAMVRACLGMCGVIYQITFKVEPLQVVMVSNYWLPLRETMGNTTFLQKATEASGMAIFWAPLSSLTYGEWQTYIEADTLPKNYDPWSDLSWVKQNSPTTQFNISEICTTSSNSRRKRRDNGHNLAPVINGQLLPGETEYEGFHPRMKRNAEETPPPLLDQWVRYNMTRGWMEWTAPLCYPHSMASVDLQYQEHVDEVGFILPDYKNFSVSQKVLEILFDIVKSKAAETPPKIPLLTYDARWIALSLDCLLCPGNMDTGDYVFTLGVVGGPTKPGFKDFITEVYVAVSKEFPHMRVHWGKYYDYLPGLPTVLKHSYSEEIDKFLEEKHEAGLDPNNMFMTNFLTRIFT